MQKVEDIFSNMPYLMSIKQPVLVKRESQQTQPRKSSLIVQSEYEPSYKTQTTL